MGPVFEKSIEDHHLAVLDAKEVTQQLSGIGVIVKELTKYHDTGLLNGRKDFECRKPRI